MVKYSKLKLISNLKARDLWSHAKDWMQNNNDYYDLFMAAVYITNEHPLFSAIITQLQAELGISGDLVNEILEASIYDEDSAAA